MVIIGVDYHPSFQAIAFLMEETGECGEQELHHSDGQAEREQRILGHVVGLAIDFRSPRAFILIVTATR